MKILKKEKLPKSQIKLEIEISKEELEKFFDQATKKLSQEIKITGFRPGKAPRNIVEKEVGSKRFQEESLQIAISQTFLDALKQENIFSIAPPQITVRKFVSSDLLVYEAVITTVPEIELPDYKGLIKKSKIKMKEVVIDEKQIDQVLTEMQRQFAKTKPVLRPAQKGDRVEVDFETSLGGRILDGGKSQNHPLILGQGMMVAGFEDQIVGMEKGQEKQFSLVFPKDYFRPELREKLVDFKVKLNEVSEVELPKIDDEFAKKLGKKNIADLQEVIKKDLEEKLKQNAKIKFEGELINLITDKTKIELPEALTHDEIHQMLNDLSNSLQAQGLTLEQYLTQIKKTKEQLEDDMKPEAERRIRIGLILAKIAQKDKIEAPEQEVEREIKQVIETSLNKEEAEKKFNTESYKRYVRNVLANRKVVKMLVELTKE